MLNLETCKSVCVLCDRIRAYVCIRRMCVCVCWLVSATWNSWLKSAVHFVRFVVRTKFVRLNISRHIASPMNHEQCTGITLAEVLNIYRPEIRINMSRALYVSVYWYRIFVHRTSAHPIKWAKIGITYFVLTRLIYRDTEWMAEFAAETQCVFISFSWNFMSHLSFSISRQLQQKNQRTQKKFKKIYIWCSAGRLSDEKKKSDRNEVLERKDDGCQQI